MAIWQPATTSQEIIR